MTKASDNPFPSVLITEGTEPAAPAAGKQRLYIDSTSHHLCRTDSGGNQVDLETASGGGYTQCARVRNSVDIPIPNASFTYLTFDTEDFDTDAIHSTGADTGRLTCQTAGKYHIKACFAIAPAGSGALRYGKIVLNRTTDIASAGGAGVQGTDITLINVDTDYSLGVGDYVEVVAYQNSGGTININMMGAYSPSFMMHRIG